MHASGKTTMLGRLALIAAMFTALLADAIVQPVALEAQLPLPHKQADPDQSGAPKLLVIVTDENGTAVASARVILTSVNTQASSKGETDYSGHSEFTSVALGAYRLRVEKEGFYVVTRSDLQFEGTMNLEVTLNHQQEFADTLNVIDSPATIDPAETALTDSLNYREILNLPYPSTRDIRNALPFIPGVIQDGAGQIHVGGSDTYQILDLLDGFNITQPVNGLLELRVSADALRSMEVQSSRYSAEYGKGSGGVLNMVTGMGDDHYRFSATNFIPSFQNHKGLQLGEWTPRATFSGPLSQKKAWFFNAADGEYKLDIIDELPPGMDQNAAWRLSNLTKVQVNLNPTNILTSSFLINHQDIAHAGLSQFSPLETTVHQTRSAYLFTVKDQAYVSNGMVLDVGFAANQFTIDDQPIDNTLPYLVRPEGTSGNYFKTDYGRARRFQGIANLNLPTYQWHGRHQVKVGSDTDWTTYDQSVERRPISILREDGTLSRRILFVGNAPLKTDNTEISGFAQDRWSLSDRLLLEGGVRLDWDQLVRQVVLSPRLASTFLLTPNGDTKLSAGIGLFHDATKLDFITRTLEGQRFDFFYGPDGQTLSRPPVQSSFLIDPQGLIVPRFVNWSFGLERMLPASIYLDVQFLQKRGSNGFAFFNQTPSQPGQSQNVFELRNGREDHYDSIQITARRSFKENYSLLVSYSRSSARSNAVLDFNFDNPIFSQQAGGPLPWDAPNRLISWGWVPLVRRFDFAYSLDWRTGFPFNVVNQEQELVGAPNSRRFPDYFSLNLHVERRFRILGLQWALRVGCNNVTNRQNPSAIINNVDSPQFLTLGGLQHRVFTARVRLLGRK